MNHLNEEACEANQICLLVQPSLLFEKLGYCLSLYFENFHLGRENSCYHLVKQLKMQ